MSISNPAFRPVQDARWADLQRLQTSSPMYDAVIDEVKGRRIRIGDHWLADFASCNYLGFDLEPEIIDSVDASIRQWGTHPSWSRLLGNPRMYIDIEERLTEPSRRRRHSRATDDHPHSHVGHSCYRGPGRHLPRRASAPNHL